MMSKGRSHGSSMEVRGRVTAISGCAVVATFISTCGTTGSEWGTTIPTTIPGIPVPQNPIWHRVTRAFFGNRCSYDAVPLLWACGTACFTPAPGN